MCVRNRASAYRRLKNETLINRSLEKFFIRMKMKNMHNLLLAVASALRVGHRQCPHKATCRSIPNSCGQNQHGPCPQGPLNMEGVGRVTEAASLTVEKTWKFPWLCPALPSLHPFPGSSHRFQVPCSPSKPEVPISVLRSH